MASEPHSIGGVPQSPQPAPQEPGGPFRPASAGGTGEAPFTREEFERSDKETLSRGRWGNADLHVYRKGTDAWVVKDFRHCPAGVRQTWGACMAARELSALRALSGIPGIPPDAFRLDRYAIAYRFVPGKEMGRADPALLTPGYFAELESLVGRVHGRGIAHLDIRTGGNVLVTDRGKPLLLDFQSHVDLRGLPRFLLRILVAVDRAGVYKHWAIRAPGTMGEEREAYLRRMNAWRRFWILKGYLGVRQDHPRRGDSGDPERHR
jgi:hypothetical protein